MNDRMAAEVVAEMMMMNMLSSVAFVVAVVDGLVAPKFVVFGAEKKNQ